MGNLPSTNISYSISLLISSSIQEPRLQTDIYVCIRLYLGNFIIFTGYGKRKAEMGLIVNMLAVLYLISVFLSMLYV